MKNILPLALFVFNGFVLKADFWTQKANYSGGYISNAIAFTIGTKGYVGLGVDSLSAYHNDFWEYDPLTNSWTQKASFPGTPRLGASAFAIGDTGYVGSGWAPGFLNDFWKYDVSSNSWIQTVSFGGTKRDFASAFSINNKGYLTCGLDSLGPISDLWEFDPTTNSWTQKASLANGIFAAVSFVINNKGYVTTGFGPLATSEYDPVANIWTPKTAFPFLLFSSAGISIGNYGYVGTGITNPTTNDKTKQWWQYNPVTDTWVQKTDFGGIERANAIAFSIGQKGYLGTGEGADFWEYTPDSTNGMNKNEVSISELTVYPNPAKDELFVILHSLIGKEKIKIIITDVNGKSIFIQHWTLDNGQRIAYINVSCFLKGIYFVTTDNGNQKQTRKIFKE